MGMYGGGSDGSEQARQMEEQRQARIQTGLGQINKTFDQFNPAFYEQRKQDYINYAMPQFYKQLGNTQRQTFYGLANRGLAGSGAADTAASNLGYEANVQKQGIADTAIQQAAQMRRDVEGQRSQLVAQLQASADPTSAAQQAIASAGAFSAPSPMAPIGNLFGNFAQMYANQQLANAYGGSYSPRYGGMSSALGNKSYSITR